VLWLCWILLVVGFLGGLVAYLIYLVPGSRDRME
jgi:hypothetical protein